MSDRVIRDPIHGYVHVADDLAPLIDSQMFQRLRRVSQTSLLSSVYPSATGSRFEHSLGTMHLAGRAFDAAWNNAEPDCTKELLAQAQRDFPTIVRVLTPGEDVSIAIRRHLRLATEAVALLHDVGHPPFSHVLEDLFGDRIDQFIGHDPGLVEEWSKLDGLPFHERAGVLLTRHLVDKLPDPLCDIVPRIYEEDPASGTWHGALHSIVAGEIDTDRLDYLVRDAQRAGTEFGAIDTARLIDSLILVKSSSQGFRVVPGLRARSAFETLLIQRAQSYRWVIFHPRVIGSNLALARALETLFEIAASSHKMASAFERTLPNLNLLSPTDDDLARLVSPTPLKAAHAAWTDDSQQGEQLRAAVLASVEDRVRASVDDSAVVEALKRALVITDLIPRGERTPEVERFGTYASAALFREKNFVVVWKTPEEYLYLAELTADDAISKVRDAFAQAIETAPDSADGLRTELEALSSAYAEHPIVGLNRLIGFVLSNRSSLDRLVQHLNSVGLPRKMRAGFWDLKYTGFKAVREGSKATVLWANGREMLLAEVSPIVADLAAANDKRPRLSAFYFLPAGNAGSDSSSSESRQNREMLRKQFAKAFLEFLALELANVLGPESSDDRGNDTRVV